MALAGLRRGLGGLARPILSSCKWAALAAVLLLAACDGGDESEPYIRFVGGGFIFNYNIAEAYYGFVARQGRTIPPGTILEARFEDPGGGTPFLVRQTARAGQIDYTFRSPPVDGVKAGVDYAVELRLLDGSSEQVMASYGKTFQSTADQDILPEAPLTVGPSYAPNPAYVGPDSPSGAGSD